MIHIQSEKRPIETLGVSQISDTADKNFKAVITYMFIEPKKIIMKEKSVAKINLQVEILHKETNSGVKKYSNKNKNFTREIQRRF